MSSKPSPITSNFLVKKGEAVVAAVTESLKPPVAAKAPEATPKAPKPAKVAKKAISEAPAPQELIYLTSLTVKVDPATFMQLKMMGVKQRKTTQTLLVEAIALLFAANAG